MITLWGPVRFRSGNEYVPYAHNIRHPVQVRRAALLSAKAGEEVIVVVVIIIIVIIIIIIINLFLLLFFIRLRTPVAGRGGPLLGCELLFFSC